MHMYMYLYMYMYMYMYLYMYVYIYIYMYICICVYIYIYTYRGVLQVRLGPPRRGAARGRPRGGARRIMNANDNNSNNAIDAILLIIMLLMLLMMLMMLLLLLIISLVTQGGARRGALQDEARLGLPGQAGVREDPGGLLRRGGPALRLQDRHPRGGHAGVRRRRRRRPPPARVPPHGTELHAGHRGYSIARCSVVFYSIV